MSYEDDVNYYAMDLLHATENGTLDDQSLAFTRLIGSDVAIADVTRRVVGIMRDLITLCPPELIEAWRTTLAREWELARIVASLRMPAYDDLPEGD